MLRARRGAAVAQHRAELAGAFTVLPADATTFDLCASAMETLALHGADAHRLPVPDLVTAALAHQHGCGVIHVDDDYETLRRHAGLEFETCQLKLAAPRAGDSSHR